MRGHLVKRAKGSWSIVLDLGRDPSTGKRRQQWVSVKGTKKEAEAKLAELLHQQDTGGYVKPTRVTVGDFLYQWLRGYAETNVRPSTLYGYKKVVDRHLVPALGNIPLTQLGPQHIQTYYTDKLARGRLDGRPGGLSATSVRGHHRILSEALSHAVKWGLVGRNVAKAVNPPRPRRPEPNVLDSDGATKLMDAARNTPYYGP